MAAWDKKKFPEGSLVHFIGDSDWAKRYKLGIVDSDYEMYNPDAYVPIRVLEFTPEFLEWSKTNQMFRSHIENGVHGGFLAHDIEPVSDKEIETIEI